MATNDPTWGITGGSKCQYARLLGGPGSVANVSLNTTAANTGSYFQWQADTTNQTTTFTFSNLYNGVGCEVWDRGCANLLAQGSGSTTLGPVAVTQGISYVIFIATDPTAGGCNLSITN